MANSPKKKKEAVKIKTKATDSTVQVVQTRKAKLSGPFIVSVLMLVVAVIGSILIPLFRSPKTSDQSNKSEVSAKEATVQTVQDSPKALMASGTNISQTQIEYKGTASGPGSVGLNLGVVSNTFETKGNDRLFKRQNAAARKLESRRSQRVFVHCPFREDEPLGVAGQITYVLHSAAGWNVQGVAQEKRLPSDRDRVDGARIDIKDPPSVHCASRWAPYNHSNRAEHVGVHLVMNDRAITNRSGNWNYAVRLMKDLNQTGILCAIGRPCSDLKDDEMIVVVGRKPEGEERKTLEAKIAQQEESIPK